MVQEKRGKTLDRWSDLGAVETLCHEIPAPEGGSERQPISGALIEKERNRVVADASRGRREEKISNPQEQAKGTYFDLLLLEEGLPRGCDHFPLKKGNFICKGGVGD